MIKPGRLVADPGRALSVAGMWPPVSPCARRLDNRQRFVDAIAKVDSDFRGWPICAEIAG